MSERVRLCLCVLVDLCSDSRARSDCEQRALQQVDDALQQFHSEIPLSSKSASLFLHFSTGRACRAVRWNPRIDSPFVFLQSLTLNLQLHRIALYSHMAYIDINELDASSPSPVAESTSPTARTRNGTSAARRHSPLRLPPCIANQDAQHVRTSRSTCIKSGRAILELAACYVARIPPPRGSLVSFVASNLYMASVALLICAETAESAPSSDTMHPSRTEFLRDIRSCLDMLKQFEPFWRPAGRLW